MTWTQTTLLMKDATGANQPVIAYTDGTNFSFAHPLLDNTGAIVSPATQATLASVLSALQGATPAGTNTIGNVTVNDPAAVTGTITAADAASTSPASLVSGQTLVTGTPTPGSVVVAAVSGYSSFSIELSGTAQATAQVEKSMDNGVTYVPVGATGVGTSTSVSTLTGTGANANAVLHGNAANITHIRVRCTAFTSGPWNVRILPGYGVFSVTAGLNAGSNVIGGVTVADGSDAALGAKADAAASSDTGTFSLIALFKRGLVALTNIAYYLAPVSGIIPLTIGVTGTAGKKFAANITSANGGSVNLTLIDGSTSNYPVAYGLNVMPFAVTRVNSSTASGTYENWK